MAETFQQADAFEESLHRDLSDAGLVAVITIDDAEDAVPLSQALLDGGVRAIELTLRTSAALESIRRIREHTSQMLVGAGTVLTPQQVREACDAGASFGVAPGLNPRVVTAARDSGLPFAPGICTPSDIETAVELGCRLLKFFPAEPIGGLQYLSSIAAPFAHLGLQFLPLGGISPKNLEQYLTNPSIAAVGGSWLAPRHEITAQSWQRITTTARDATQQVHSIRPGANAS